MFYARIMRCDAVAHPPHSSDLVTTLHKVFKYRVLPTSITLVHILLSPPWKTAL